MTVGRWVRRMSWLVSVLTAVSISGVLLAGCDESAQLQSGRTLGLVNNTNALNNVIRDRTPENAPWLT